MAKGDSGRAQAMITSQGGQMQRGVNDLNTNLGQQNTGLQSRFNTAADQGNADYGRLMSGYGQFAANGGFSPQDIQDIRARAIAPTRSVFASAQANIDRQRALGGYSPNYTAATAKLARDRSQSASDANVNANASIAQLIQQGKLAGLGGQAGVYSSAPGMASMYGNQLANSNNAMIGGQGLGNQVGLGLIGSQINKAGIPGNYQQAMGNIASTLGVIGQGASAVTGMGMG